MVRLIPMLILMGVFAVIGLYWAVLTGHFLAWTEKYKDSFHKFVDSKLTQPVIERAKENYAQLNSARGSVVLTWGVRMIGVVLAGMALVTICELFVYGM